MQSDDLNHVPNPFSLHVDGNDKNGKNAFTAAAKFFVLVALLFSVTLALTSYSRHWAANRLMSNFDELDSAEKKRRLLQFSQLGIPGIEPLVLALVDQQTDVAQTAYELLQASQNTWTSLEWSIARRHHLILVESLQQIASRIPEQQTQWSSRLLQQTIMESVPQKDDKSKELYDLATRVLAQVSLSESAGPSILDDQPLDPKRPVRLAVRSKPLPVSESDALQAWIDWPIGESSADGHRPNSTHQGAANDSVNGMMVDPGQRADDDTSHSGGPSIYRSSTTKLNRLQEGETVLLKNVHNDRESASVASVKQSSPQASSPQASSLQATSFLTTSPLEAYDTESVIRWLGNEQASFREQAKQELTKRGFTRQQIEIATQITSNDANSRLALVDAMARSNIDNPRPWLAMLLNDENRQVRLQVISVIATMNDPVMNDRMRKRLVDEHDPIVNARIRRVLDLR